jgi:hypothetical protein
MQDWGARVWPPWHYLLHLPIRLGSSRPEIRSEGVTFRWSALGVPGLQSPRDLVGSSSKGEGKPGGGGEGFEGKTFFSFVNTILQTWAWWNMTTKI